MMAARDLMFIAVLIFGFGIAFFAAHYALNESLDAMIENPVINQTNESVTALQDAKDLTARFDYILFALFIGLVLALIITGWFIGGQPIFMFIYFIVVVIATILSAVLSNVWDTVVSTVSFASDISAFPITNHLISNLPIYIAIVGFIGIVVMFAKPALQNE